MQIFLKLKILLPTIINELVCIHPLHNLRHAFNIYIYIYLCTIGNEFEVLGVLRNHLSVN